MAHEYNEVMHRCGDAKEWERMDVCECFCDFMSVVLHLVLFQVEELPPLQMKRIRLHTENFDSKPWLWNSLFQSVDMVRDYYFRYFDKTRETEPFKYWSDGTVEFHVHGHDEPVIESMGSPRGKDNVFELRDENGVKMYDRWFEIIKERRFACGRGEWDEQFMRGLSWLAPLWFVVCVCHFIRYGIVSFEGKMHRHSRE